MNKKNEQEKVISLEERRFDILKKNCEHNKIIVDEKRMEVECANCGALLNPVWVLVRMTRQESIWRISREAFLKALDKYNQKKRVKCEHCGKFTSTKI